MRRGFTLIETVIYAGLISVMLGFVLLVVYGVVEGRARVAARLELEEETNFLMRKIAWVLTGVGAVSIPAPGATSTALSVTKLGFAQNPVVIQVASSTMTVSYGGGPATVLNSENVAVKTLVFQGLPGAGSPGVHVSLGLEFLPRTQFALVNATTSVETTIYARKQ